MPKKSLVGNRCCGQEFFRAHYRTLPAVAPAQRRRLPPMAARSTGRSEPTLLKRRGRALRSNTVGERGVCLLLLLGVTALASSALMSRILPHVLAWRRASACLPTDSSRPGAAPCPPEASHPTLDVVSVAAKPTCVTRLAVAALNQYVGPRRIVFVSSNDAACARLSSFASNVECVPEDDLIPGVTKAAVDAELARLYGGGGTAGGNYMGRSNGGWYLQQLVKLGAARYLRGLSETFLVWDPDMIPLWPVRVFGDVASAANGGKRRAFRQIGGYVIRAYESSYAKLVPGERIQYAPDGSSYVTHQMVMEKAYVEELLGAFGEAWERRLSMESAVKASAAAASGAHGARGAIGAKDPRPRVDPGGELDGGDDDDVDVDDGDDTGGWRDADDFVRRRRRRIAMFEAWPEDRDVRRGGGGKRAEPRRAGSFERVGGLPDGDSPGAHPSGDSPGAISSGAAVRLTVNAAPRPMPAWASAVLASLPEDSLALGFSEYAAYASWVATRHPESVEVAPTRTWSRHPFGPLIGSLGVRAQRMANRDGLCCPGPAAVRAMKLLGYQYAGFEIGHVGSCGLDLPRHRDSYGL